jgi:hypothetical protein
MTKRPKIVVVIVLEDSDDEKHSKSLLILRNGME